MPADKPQSQGAPNTGTERYSTLPGSCGPRRFAPGRTGSTGPPAPLLKELYKSYRNGVHLYTKNALFFGLSIPGVSGPPSLPGRLAPDEFGTHWLCVCFG